MSSVAEQVKGSPRRGEARTQAILESTIELLSEVGYDRMTMDALAARAKASKATIYRRWPDKTALVLDALRSRGSMLPELPDSGSLRGDLEHYVRASVAATTGTVGSLVVGLLAVSTHDPELANLLAQQFHYEQLPAITRVLDRARDRGELSPDVDPLVITEVLPGTMIMHLLVLGLPGDEAFIARLVDDVLTPVLTAGARKQHA